MKVTAVWMLLDEILDDPDTTLTEGSVRVWVLYTGNDQMGTWVFPSCHQAVNYILDDLGFMEEATLIDLRGVPGIMTEGLFRTQGIKETLKGLANGSIEVVGVLIKPIINTSFGNLSRTILSENKVTGDIVEGSLLSFLQDELKQLLEEAKAPSVESVRRCARGITTDGYLVAGYVEDYIHDANGVLALTSLKIPAYPEDAVYEVIPGSLHHIPDFKYYPMGRTKLQEDIDV